MHDTWRERVREGYSKAVPVVDFFSTYMRVDDETAPLKSEIQEIVKKSKKQLRKTSKLIIGTSTWDCHSKYNSFVDYLTEVVRDFPPDTKPVFHNIWETTFYNLRDTQYYTRPDVASTLPGFPLPDDWDWYNTGSFIDFKFEEDPFLAQDNHIIESSEEKTLIQLVKNTHRMLMATRACYTFVVSVFGMRARLFRVDRAGFIVTHPFVWSKNRDLHVFPEFYWRLYRGRTRGYMLGHDTTVFDATDDEKSEIRAKLEKMQEYSSMDLFDATARSCRVQVKVGEATKDAFTFGEPIFQSEGLFGRCTHVEFVLIDGKVCVMKNAWREECYRPEHHFYAVIRDYVKRELEGEWPANLSAWQGTLELWENDTDHKTITAALRRRARDGSLLPDRCHDRSVFSSIGTALGSFESTKQLVQALRAAIAGHEIAYKAGVLHRDISVGNVLLLSDGGFLLDFDYSEFTDDGSKRFKDLYPEVVTQEIDKTLKGKGVTGTFPFMSIGLLQQIEYPIPSFCHSYADDLEGFYWVLLWVIVRHIEHEYPMGRVAPARLFDGRTTNVFASKISWIFRTLAPCNRHRLVVINNAPLTNLVGALTNIIAENLRPPFILPTHKSFLEAFDVALASSGWPENDKSRKHKPTPIHDSPHSSVNPNVDAPVPPPSLPPSRSTSGRVFPIKLFELAAAPGPAAASGCQGGVGGSPKRKRGEETDEEEEEQGPVRCSVQRAAAPANKFPLRNPRRRTTIDL